jgi:hypothetical protein
MKPRRFAWALCLLFLAAPPVDAWLHREMARLVLLEMPAWIALGWAAPSRWERRRRGWNPHGFTGLSFGAGAVAFWMIPKSIDAIGASAAVDGLMHASLFVAGAGLAHSFALLPFVVRGAIGVYGASMTFALGTLYTSYSALLCGTFNLAQQRATGERLLTVCPLLTVFVLASGARALGRQRNATPLLGANPAPPGSAAWPGCNSNPERTPV